VSPQATPRTDCATGIDEFEIRLQKIEMEERKLAETATPTSVGKEGTDNDDDDDDDAGLAEDIHEEEMNGKALHS